LELWGVTAHHSSDTNKGYMSHIPTPPPKAGGLLIAQGLMANPIKQVKAA
jgi:hypothetical protein